ncbi:deuterosome assembly protein 1 isoform X7 [Antechinus flavipes]|uniref:deuterosome assembly protein 1 isoform X7 n=1 Tax=Antechinus flavipes TaxID=38775 RepID=UPI0022356ADD|nr:deuterosome assembly protein 1 isoform X7 [Antechinus flavipes]
MESRLEIENPDQNLMGSSTCEAELQELMEQIDIMVSNKKMDWERKMRALETRLDLRDQELANAQNCLDQKGQEEFRAKSREWDKQEILYQNHLVSLDAQQKLLSEKCNQFQKQAQSYQSQLNGKKQCLEDASLNNPEIARLTCEPDIDSDTVERDEFIIEKLKSAVSEIAISRNKLQDENQKLLQELKMYQRQCQTMEAGLSEVKNELQSRDDLLRVIEMERLQLHRELLKIGEYQNFQDNPKRLEPSYSHILKEPERKKKELFSLTADQANQEKELNKLQIRNNLYQEEQSPNSEQERMRTEISDLTEELHQKEITIATVMKKAALLERQLKMELEIKEKMLAKQQLSDMRYKAVRSENTHLKGMMGDLETGRYLTSEVTDAKNVDYCNKEHARYTASINKLEYENERLRNDLAKLQANGKTPWTNPNAYDETVRQAYQAQIKIKENEDRFIQDCEPNLGVITTSSPMVFQPQCNIFSVKDIASPLESEDGVYPLSPPEMSFPASLAAQHFLMEEEKRAKDLEKLLNTHIDELQRHTEYTLNKYTRLKQNRHI